MAYSGTVPDLLTSILDRGLGNECCIDFRGEVTTFNAFEKTTSSIAGHLNAFLEFGNKVAFLLPDSTQVFELYMGTMKAGMVSVPINWRNTPREITNIFVHSQAKCLIIHQSRLQDLEKVVIDSTLLEYIFVDGGELNINDGKINTNKTLVRFDTFGGLLETGRQDSEIKCLPWEWVRENHSDLQLFLSAHIDENTPALIVFTSGSTGNPKGVLHSHKTIRFAGQCFAHSMGLKDFANGDIYLQATASQHISGVGSFLAALLNGIPFHFLGSVPTGVFVDHINRNKPTHLCALTAQFHLMAHADGITSESLKRVKRALTGGDTVPVTLRQKFLDMTGCVLTVAYGQTECCISHCNDGYDPNDVTIGTPAPGIEARIVDPSTGEFLPTDTVGEIALKSEGLMLGYFNNENATRDAFIGNTEYYKTGDLAKVHKYGKFHFCGRQQHAIKFKSSLIYSSDVEEACHLHPYVLEAAAVGRVHPAVGEIPTVYVSLRENPETSEVYQLSEKELQDFLMDGILAEYKVPKQIEVLQVLPKGKTGKIDRRLLKEMINKSTKSLDMVQIAHDNAVANVSS